MPGNDGPVRDDDVLPEDRFHKADLVSQHYIQQKMQGREEKQQKYEKEKEAERVKTGRPKDAPEPLYRTETYNTDGTVSVEEVHPEAMKSANAGDGSTPSGANEETEDGKAATHPILNQDKALPPDIVEGLTLPEEVVASSTNSLVFDLL